MRVHYFAGWAALALVPSGLSFGQSLGTVAPPRAEPVKVYALNGSITAPELLPRVPGAFNKDDLTCPSGGTYTLSSDGLNGVCSRHGHPHHLVPCCETPVTQVTRDEAREYKTFVTQYSQYWRTFFDPIAQGWFVGRPELIGSDGIHPTDAGHAYMADKIAPLIGAQLARQI